VKSLVLIVCLLSLSLAVTSAHAVTFTTIDFPGALLTEATGINSSGQIVGFYNISGIRGFLLNGGVYTSIDFPGAGVSTWCEGINDNGDIVGWYIAPGNANPQGFLMQGGVFTTLSFPGATSTSPYGINNAGEIVGEYSTGVGVHGFTYQSGTYTDVTVPGATYTQLRGINNVGDIVGYFAKSAGDHGLLLSNGVQHFLNAPGAQATFASGVNDRKHIVGFQLFLDGTFSGFTFFDGNYMSITLAGSPTVKALAIDNNLDIVGEYTNKQGVAHGFLRTP
jgi:uncharacterized membrane protein